MADGVDVITVSLGPSSGTADLTAPTFTAMFNADKAGVLVAGSAAISGPSTVSNSVPVSWRDLPTRHTHLGLAATATEPRSSAPLS